MGQEQSTKSEVVLMWVAKSHALVPSSKDYHPATFKKHSQSVVMPLGPRDRNDPISLYVKDL